MKSADTFYKEIINSRKELADGISVNLQNKAAEEGGCGVVGFAASVPVSGRHIFEPSVQMHNRGNGKGGGIACACLDHKQLGVEESVLRDSYILQIALLHPDADVEVEAEYITPNYEVARKTHVSAVADWKELGIPVQPPDIVRYFVRSRKDVLRRFAGKNGCKNMNERDIEDEFVYQNSFRLNQQFYASLGEKKAFVLSHARNLLIFKIVGYAEQVVQYYGLEDLHANIWIAHQRYPTKGRVWHPAGSHPFIGMNEALVHNGDFANYHGITEYLRQHGITPQFLTDTEVSVQLFDLLSRVYKYPLEYVIEALAPTLELDFDRLPEEKQRAYKMVQSVHMHSAPDGPWFFIIARSKPDSNMYRLIGITDTAMLRPQVFAYQEGDVSIGLIASEKQAIDATLLSLSEDDNRFRPIADRYWNARGGSHTDGGAFTFTVRKKNGSFALSVADKFGKVVTAPKGDYKIDIEVEISSDVSDFIGRIGLDIRENNVRVLFSRVIAEIKSWKLEQLQAFLKELERIASKSDDLKENMLELLTLLNDRRYDCGVMRRRVVLELIRATIDAMLNEVPLITSSGGGRFARIDWGSRDKIRSPRGKENVLVIYASEFPPEGDYCDSRLAVEAYKLGWKQFIVYGLKGQRFHGCGFGSHTGGISFDIYGSSGDYCASGIDGMDIRVHDNGQDQIGQIMKSGCLVVYGDVGQTFMYGAKGGEVYVMGNAAGRPLINAVGRPRVVINGTCLDFLAESFMAGDPHNGGGFVILNGVEFDDRGNIREQVMPYPGSNLFSLASGGAIFIRDPHHKVLDDQLNGGEITEFDSKDWELILPYLKRNAELFGISVEKDLLTVDGKRYLPGEIYRKVSAVKLDVLAKTGAGK